MRGSTSNRDDYRKSFLRHVHHLLQLSYASLTPSAFAASEEDDITGELCRHMQVLTEQSPTEPWMSLYSVHDQNPVHGVLDSKTNRIKRGKRRPRLDIRFVSKWAVPNPRFCVEAKRLYRSDSVTSYMDDEGLGAFVAGYYARDDAAGGMLGYVQSDSIDHWLSKIRARLNEDTTAQVVAPKDQKSIPHAFHAGPSRTIRSQHQRAGIAQTIDVYHTLLLFM